MEDAAKALELMERMEALLPMTVYAAPPLLAMMKEEGEKRSKNGELLVTKLIYSGDVGGITCAIETGNGSPYVVSITHLIIPDNNPLAEEIKAISSNESDGCDRAWKAGTSQAIG